MIDLYSSISEIGAQNFNPTVKLAISTETPTNEANAETETHPMTAETKTRKFSK